MQKIKLSGDVGGPDFNIELLDHLKPGPVHITIDSGGGCPLTSAAIFEKLREHGGLVTTEVIRAGSAAVLPALAGDVRLIRGSGWIFVHRCWASTIGTVRELKRSIQVQEEWDQHIAGLYAERTGQAKNKILQLMSSEIRFGAVEAVRLGFVHKIIGPVQPIETTVNLDEIAIACLEDAELRSSPVMKSYRRAAEPMARKNAAVEKIIDRPIPKLKILPGKSAEALEAFAENTRRETEIRERLARRLRNAVNGGGHVEWPIRAIWTCLACGKTNHHPPAQNCLATPCAFCAKIREDF